MNKKEDFPYIIAQYLLLWIIGGFVYVLIELAYRGRSHWSMAVVGGLCFIAIGDLNENNFPGSLRAKTFEGMVILGALETTFIEFVSGVIINMILHWDVWDYSNTPFNVLGQICLPFTLIWMFIAAIAIIVDDFLRHVLFMKPFTKYRSVLLNKEADVFELWEKYVCKNRHKSHD